HLEIERPFLRSPGATDLRIHERMLDEARPRVWETARVLSEARRRGPAALKARVDELGSRSLHQVAELLSARRRRFRLARPSLGVALEA
ncbi:MAG: hypothetical protein ACXVWF_02755, partial [Actinomycetota bacterium]